jgi:adenosine kinase
MPALICGSLAFDTITNFPGRFSQQILPDQVHILNVSFLVPTLRREFGGCAGNIAYTLQALGGQPVVMAALGNDGGDYLARLQGWGADTSLVLRDDATYTAQAIIITDTDNNQITAFHPGAMQQAHRIDLPSRDDLQIAIIAPDGREAMIKRAQQLGDAWHPLHLRPRPAVADVRRQRAAPLRRARILGGGERLRRTHAVRPHRPDAGGDVEAGSEGRDRDAGP